MRDRSSHALALRLALFTCLGSLGAGSLAAAGCSSQAAPSDEAIARYVRGGPSAPSDDPHAGPSIGAAGSALGTAGAPDGPPPPPRAMRISLTVERGEGLQDHDGPGVTDPYVMLEIEGNRGKTSVVEGSLTPVWGDSFAFDLRPDSVLQVRLMDEDNLASDELIGTVVLPLPPVRVGEKAKLEAAFKNGDEGRVFMTIVGIGSPTTAPNGPR